MNEAIGAVFVTGFIFGAVIVTTLLVVPLIRYIILIAAACAIGVIFLHGGAIELVACVNGLLAEAGRNAIFSLGALVGATVVALSWRLNAERD
jgi:hypothetical protein